MSMSHFTTLPQRLRPLNTHSCDLHIVHIPIHDFYTEQKTHKSLTIHILCKKVGMVVSDIFKLLEQTYIKKYKTCTFR